jgi:hypothetical protein
MRCLSRTIIVTGVVLVTSSPVFAQSCPAAKNGKTGFVVARGDNQKSEIFHTDGGIVRTVMRYAGTTQLETTQFEGIFQLDRLDRGRRMTIKPQTELSRLFPLKAGRNVLAKFDYVDASGRATQGTVSLVVKSADPIFIGPCKYSVLKIDRSESRGESAARYLYTEYYSPELKLILMKEYRDPDSKSRFVKYDRIYPLGN